jgi:class 3 adenylate cyclase
VLNLPSGTVTFLFSDIEGSTDLLKRLGDDRYEELLATHRRLLRDAFAARDGREIDTQGDAFFYSFPRARDAVTAAVEAQRALAAFEWADGVAVRVRIGLHTGEPVVGDEGYTGLDVVRAARIAAVARGGQVLLSEVTRALVGNDLPEGVAARAIGEQRLKDIDRPEPLHELVVDGLSASPARETEERTDEGDPFERLAQNASRAIEQRVLAELERAFASGFPGSPSADPPNESSDGGAR